MADSGATTTAGKPPREHLAEHYDTLESQEHAAHFGMWIFLAGELLLFSAMFMLYAGSRGRFPEAFKEGANETVLWMGTTGTFLLLLASFLVASALYTIKNDRHKATSWLLGGAALMGVLFLVLKFWEWAKHMHEGLLPGRYFHHPSAHTRGLQIFFNLYYIMTGAHALHVIIGVVLLSGIAWRARRGAYSPTYHVPVELGGMYWHLVDLIWLFLWPFFYLMR